MITEDVGLKTLVVLLPGLNGSRLELGQLPKYIQESGFDVAIPDIVGYEHGCPASNLESWLEQAHSFLDNQKDNYSRFDLIGISMGATLSAAIASQRSDVDSLVLLSPVLKYDGWSVPWYRPILDFACFLGIQNWSYVEREPFGLKNTDLRRRIKERFESSRVSEVGAISISGKHLWQAIRLMALVRRELKNIHSKLMVIQAVEDDTCTVWSAEYLLQNVGSVVRKAVWLGNSYHIITIDNEREIVLNEVIHFLGASRGHEAGSASYKLRSNKKSLRARRG